MAPPPLHVQMQLKQAFNLLNTGQNDKARNLGAKILKAMPKEPNALYLMGVLHHQSGDLKDAAKFFERSYGADRCNPAALNGMGIVRLDQKRFGEAAKIFEDLRRQMPNEPVVLNNLSLAYKGLQRQDKAIPAFEAAISARPDYADAYSNLGAMLNAVGELIRSREILQAGIARCPKDPLLYLNLADAQSAGDDIDDALATLRRGLAIAPEDREMRSRLASLLVNKGAFEEARGILDDLLMQDADDPRSYFDMADLVEIRPQNGDQTPDTYRAAGLAAFEQNKDAEEPTAILACRIAQAYEAQGEYGRAFDFYHHAQSAFKAGLASIGKVYSRAAKEALVDRLIERFSTMPPPTPTGEPVRPIFIVGMPRSGTSLLEQILASHPAVFGAGELMVLPELIQARLPTPSIGSMEQIQLDLTEVHADILATTSEDMLADLAMEYLSAVAERNDEAQFVTDKLPNNFVNTGLIRRMFPGALILNSQRHPLDVGWSIYVQKFGSDLLFDHDLGDIGHYYRQYDRLMRFWRDWDPTIVTVRYEDVVTDMLGTILPILDRLGLNWDPAMARFFESDREVRTASRLQVRRPIYTSSLARWRHFGDKLGLMRDEMGDLPARYEEGD